MATKQQHNEFPPGSIDSDVAVDREGNITDDDNAALKRDDQGAIEQQLAARTAELKNRPRSEDQDVTKVEKGGAGSIRIVSRLEQDIIEKGKDAGQGKEVAEAHLNGMQLWLEGKGLDPGEAIIDVIGPGQGHIRYSAWVDDDEGTFAMQLATVNMAGDWQVVVYHAVTNDIDAEEPRRVIEEVGRTSVTIHP